jgi:hypothetical protein
LNITPEGLLQREIRDIIDELDIMTHIVSKQKDVVRKFKKHVEGILDPDHRWKSGQKPNPDLEEELKKCDSYQWFSDSAEDLLGDVDDHLEELRGLKESASSTSKSVRNAMAMTLLVFDHFNQGLTCTAGVSCRLETTAGECCPGMAVNQTRRGGS